MRIGGLEKFSLIDYPGAISAIIFTVGCNFRCPFCHNPALVEETIDTNISKKEILNFLKKRIGALDAVTITGGEPTMHSDLIPFIKSIKKLGFKIKLDSNGTNPEVLRKVLKENLVDYLAMDIKSTPEKYMATVGRPVNLEKIKESIQIIMSSGIPYEFRTTVVKALIPENDFHEIGKMIRGAERYFLQKFIPSNILNPQFLKKTTYSDDEFKSIKTIMEQYVKECSIR